MAQIDERFRQIIDKRRSALPAVDRQLEALQSAASALSGLDQAIDELGAARSIPVELVDKLRAVDLAGLAAQVDAAQAVVRNLRIRLARDTINIGVGGRARAGKSTLLQAISGLGDQQIPTADGGLPVTAVRSCIYHTEGSADARLTMHTYGSFRTDVLAPFHTLLELADPPATIEAYRALRYPVSEELAPHVPDKDGALSALADLKVYQASLPSFEALLTGGERLEGLEGLRSWVAYPTTEGSTDRPYLAVREARILCAFPRAAVRSLSIRDTPGVGEVVPDAEQRHLQGLRDEADYVLIVHRPDSMSIWDDRAVKVNGLVNRAKGPVRDLRDFAGLLVNSGATDPEKRDVMVASILAKVNEGVPDKNMRVFETDAKDPDRVYDDVLGPVLDHLAERLPEMDRQHGAEAAEQIRLLRDRAGHDLAAIERAIQDWAVTAPNTQEQLDVAVSQLRSTLAIRLQDLIGTYRAVASQDAVDDAFVESVEASYNRLLEWAADGFGRGDAAWKAEARAEVAREGTAAGFATRELNAVRNHIAREFGDLDGVCQRHVDRVHAEVAGLLASCLGDLIAGAGEAEDGAAAAALAELARLAADAYEPCEQIPRTILRLLELRLDYSTLILPRVRRDLDLLDSQRLLETGELVTSDIDQLLVTMRQLTEQAAWEAKKALLGESVTPCVTVLVALEQFEDAVIRSAGAERELRRLARSYRDEIWPGAFQGPNAASGRLTGIRRSLHDLLDELASAAGGGDI